MIIRIRHYHSSLLFLFQTDGWINILKPHNLLHTRNPFMKIVQNIKCWKSFIISKIK